MADKKQFKGIGNFDWHSALLTKDTIITDDYKNSQNVRRFFVAALGSEFKFSVKFMAWLKSNSGKTLGDACLEYEGMKIS